MTQGNKSFANYDAKFNRLVKFSPNRIRGNERAKVQKFKDGLSLELQHDVHGFDLPTLGELVNKAKAMEEIREKMKV